MDNLAAPKITTFQVPPGATSCLVRWTSADGQNYSFLMDLAETEKTYGAEEPKEQEPDI